MNTLAAIRAHFILFSFFVFLLVSSLLSFVLRSKQNIHISIIAGKSYRINRQEGRIKVSLPYIFSTASTAYLWHTNAVFAMISSAISMNTLAKVGAPKDSQVTSTSEKNEEKVSPSTILPNFKEFKIDHTKYKHYGHSMTSHQLLKIISGPEADDAPKPGESPPDSNIVSPLQSPAEHIAKTLESPEQNLYSEAVISQIISLRIEQERTKQIHEKVKLGQTVSQLIKDAEAHGFGPDLIRRLFLDDDDFKADADKIPGRIAVGQTTTQPKKAQLFTPSPNKSPVITPEAGLSLDAQNNTHANPQQPFTTCYFLPQTRLLPPLLPKKHESHARARSDGTIGSYGSPTCVSASVSIVSDTPANAGSHTHTSPGSSLTQGRPPMFHHGVPEHHYAHNRTLFTNSHPQSATRNSSESGSPRLTHKNPQQYQTISNFAPAIGIFNTKREHPSNSPRPHPDPNHGPPFQQPLPHPQYGHPPFYYAGPSQPGIATGPMVPSSYFHPPLNSGVNTKGMNMIPRVTSVVHHEKKKDHDEEHRTHKKQRGTKGGISFMISTPKNPPARKYNKPSGST